MLLLDTGSEQFTLDSILSGVQYFRCHDHTQLIAVARTLDTFLQQHPKVSCCHRGMCERKKLIYSSVCSL